LSFTLTNHLELALINPPVKLGRLLVGFQVGLDIGGLVVLVAQEIGLLLAGVSIPASSTETFPTKGAILFDHKNWRKIALYNGKLNHKLERLGWAKMTSKTQTVV
jgi:hypothetical protein